MNVKPTRDRVVIQVIGPDTTSRGGIIIPESAAEAPIQGQVLATGPGRFTDLGSIVPLEVKVGDRVVFADRAGQPIKVDGQEYRVLKEEDIIAIVE